MNKKIIYFVDDVNMPKLDEYGSQASIEMLRQLLDLKVKAFFFYMNDSQVNLKIF